MKKIMIIYGTRPEAIKMAPLVKAIQRDSRFHCVVCVTGQHRDLLDRALDLFDITPEYDLDIMEHGQSIVDIITKSMSGIDKVIRKEKPDLVLVHGDTTTSSTAAQIAFLNKVPVGHVEAGLRSYNRYSPFPEEINRKIISTIASLHFAPTQKNAQNLIDEGIKEHIYVTGNTVIDALLSVIEPDYSFDNDQLNQLDFYNRKVILLTCHRRENWGAPMMGIFSAVRQVVQSNPDVEIVYPIHPNPTIGDLARKIFQGLDRVNIVDSLDYKAFVNLMNKAYIILTDSGGLQEEAPALDKPVLVLRTETERQEAIDAGSVKLVGVKKKDIVHELDLLLSSQAEYNRMKQSINPFGCGRSTETILNIITEWF